MIRFKATTTGGEAKSKEIILGETDPLWPQLRHMHIADAINWILDGFNTFISENKATKFAKKGKVTDLKEMGEAMKAMPQYTEMISKYSLHINLTTHCMTVFQEKGLARLAEIEQAMATGEDNEGRPVKNLLSSLPPLLTDNSVR
jgi:syntaxin-binding protein 1